MLAVPLLQHNPASPLPRVIIKNIFRQCPASLAWQTFWTWNHRLREMDLHFNYRCKSIPIKNLCLITHNIMFHYHVINCKSAQHLNLHIVYYRIFFKKYSSSTSRSNYFWLTETLSNQNVLSCLWRICFEFSLAQNENEQGIFIWQVNIEQVLWMGPRAISHHSSCLFTLESL